MDAQHAILQSKGFSLGTFLFRYFILPLKLYLIKNVKDIKSS